MSADGLVLITGANGFLGRALCTRFDQTGRPYRALVRRPMKGAAALPKAEVAGDLATASQDVLDEALAGVRTVIHLAGRAEARPESAREAERRFEHANTVATERLAVAAARAGVARFVLSSTVKVSGESSPPERPMKPRDPPHPADAYARSKLAAERALVTAAAATKMAVIILRLPMVYGPRATGNFRSLLKAIVAGRTLPLGSVTARRSMLYVGNFVDAIEAVIDVERAPTGVHFVADAKSIAIRDLALAIGEAIGEPAHLVNVPVVLLRFAARILGRRGEIEKLTTNLEVDATSFISATGWSPKLGLIEALAATREVWRNTLNR